MNAIATAQSEKFQTEFRYLLVKIGPEVFGLPISSIREVIELSNTTSIPMSNSVVRGVINVRGTVIPVLDLQKRLGFKQSEKYDKYSCVVLYDYYDPTCDELMTIGLVVNAVISIKFIKPEELELSPSFGSNIPRHYVWKMAKINDTLITLLDIIKTVNIEEINSQLKTSQEAYFHAFFQKK